jgi:hypothetical protein
MLKKFFASVAAAAAVSIPLAGLAFADQPDDPSSNSTGIGAGGVPQKVGEVTHQLGGNPSGDPVTPGSAINQAKDAFPGNTPSAYGAYLDAFVAPVLGTSAFGRTAPGLGVKTVTPGCDHGTSGGGNGICS